jgi:hypothetical protein
MEYPTHPTPNAQTTTARLTDVRNTLARTLATAALLADQVRLLELSFAEMDDPDPFDFYVPTDSPMGLKVWTIDGSGKPAATDQVGTAMKDNFLARNPRTLKGKANVRRDTVKAVLALRAIIDESIRVVGTVADLMDDPSKGVPDRWTAQAVGDLRKLRGAIIWGHPPDIVPSALPMIKRGVIERLRDCSEMVRGRMEAIKSAMAAGATPVDQKMAALTASIGRLEAVESKLAKATKSKPNRRARTGVDDFKPASYFPKSCRSKIRQAANAKGRRTMKVRKRTIQGVIHYSVQDFKRNWPADYERMMSADERRLSR